jgi:alcohol dehydrogenase
MNLKAFEVSRLPRLVFGEGTLSRVPSLIEPYAGAVLLVTGARSFQGSPSGVALLDSLKKSSREVHSLAVAGEPSPQLVDQAVAEFKGAGVGVVVGIGGGSALDAAKAIAGLLRVNQPVQNFLEGVGPELPYGGPAVPFVAVPTTAGTGSEATRNAVLSQRGPGGFKKSFRDEKLVAEVAVLDPLLLASCSQAQIAANGMDGLTQLLEAYLSPKASPFTDALAEAGLRLVGENLPVWYSQTDRAAQARGGQLYAAWLSGVALAHAGLGAVHGLASPLGAFFPLGHGEVCGTLVASCTKANLKALRQRQPESAALGRYAKAGRLLTGQGHLDDAKACQALVEVLERWCAEWKLPRLSAGGVTEAQLAAVVAGCRGGSMKTNPVVLTDGELTAVLQERL